MSRNCVVAFLVSSCVTIAGLPAIAGPLDPPPGPVIETDTLRREADARIPLNQQTTPGEANALYVIAAPGSYYLTEDTIVATSMNGILVTASDVTIDLNGYRLEQFSLRGGGDEEGRGGGATFSGIASLSGGSLQNVAVRNGVIRGFSDSAISFEGVDAAVLEDLSVSDIADESVVLGDAARVQRVTCSNVGSGFETQSNAFFVDCVVNSTTNGGGFLTGANSSFTRCVAIGTLTGFSTNGIHNDCIAFDNRGDGFEGEGTFVNCVAEQNDGEGFSIDGPSTLTACRALRNGTASTDAGFRARFRADGTIFRSCVADENPVGFTAEVSAIFDGCSSHDATNDGFRGSSTVNLAFMDCHASGSGDDGFELRAGDIAERCVAEGNRFGIFGAEDGAVIRGCTAIGNDNSGVLASNRSVVVVKCIASANGTNFSVSSNPLAGPVFGSITPTTATHPQANFEYVAPMMPREARADPKGGQNR